MNPDRRKKLEAVYAATRWRPPGGQVSLVDDPAEARRRYRLCLAEGADPDSPCRLEEIDGSEGRMLAVRATLGGVRGPLHRCDRCGCVVELRALTAIACPRGVW